jgi:ribosome-associated heat shock protein Hsp15
VFPGSDKKVRLDKWLWAVRVFRTRSQAAAACQAGHVKVNGSAAKPSRPVHPGEIITASVGQITRTVKVLASLDRRVGAPIVPDFLEDQTPASEYQKRREPQCSAPFMRPKGTGRPTKKDRRDLARLWKPADS